MRAAAADFRACLCVYALGLSASHRRSGLPPSQVSSRAGSKTLSRAEAEELLARLRSDDDPLFADVAASVAAGEEPPAAARPAAASVVSTASVPPPPRVSSFAAFKRKLLPRIGRSRKSEHAPVPRASNELPPGTLGHGYSPGSYAHFAAEAGLPSSTTRGSFLQLSI